MIAAIYFFFWGLNIADAPVDSRRSVLAPALPLPLRGQWDERSRYLTPALAFSLWPSWSRWNCAISAAATVLRETAARHRSVVCRRPHSRPCRPAPNAGIAAVMVFWQLVLCSALRPRVRTARGRTECAKTVAGRLELFPPDGDGHCDIAMGAR